MPARTPEECSAQVQANLNSGNLEGLMALYELMSSLNLRNSHLGLMLLFPSAISVALFVMRMAFCPVRYA